PFGEERDRRLPHRHPERRVGPEDQDADHHRGVFDRGGGQPGDDGRDGEQEEDEAERQPEGDRLAEDAAWGGLDHEDSLLAGAVSPLATWSGLEWTEEFYPVGRRKAHPGRGASIWGEAGPFLGDPPPFWDGLVLFRTARSFFGGLLPFFGRPR